MNNSDTAALRLLLEGYVPHSAEEAADRDFLLGWLKLFPENCLSRDNIFGHFTSTGFVMNETLDRCLMVYHNLRNCWSWTGGHADGDGDLLAVAVREALEETGVPACPLIPEPVLLGPLTMESHWRRGEYVSAHLHLNLTYVLIADETVPLTVKPDENSGVRWFTLPELCAVLQGSERDVALYTRMFELAKLAAGPSRKS